jgi:predicted Zn-dependent peptidase
MFAKTVLDNGIRVISYEMPEHRSVSLGIWVENGSRHESAAQNGISHFIEHLLFKGTERRSAAEIAEAMDAVGGVLNAFTSKEHLLYAKVLDENLPLAIDLLSDIFLHSTFDAAEIERERSVIL